jgi:hypothetical protein
MLPLLVILSLTVTQREASATTCAGTVLGEQAHGAVSAVATTECAGVPSRDDGAVNNGNAPQTKTIDCGPRLPIREVPPALPGFGCSQIASLCALAPGEAAEPNTTTTITQTKIAGTWIITAHDCAAAAGPPQLTAAAVRQEAQRLVPRPAIGSAPPGGITLVNIQTLLWVDTPAQRALGTVPLLGHQVTLEVHVAQVTWDFGDGATDTTNLPGPKYDPHRPCMTKLCPDYWGHIYTTTGTKTIQATVTWTGRYRVDTGAWQTIPGTVTGPPSTTTITVREARGVLVANDH